MSSPNLPPFAAELPQRALADFLDQSKTPMQLPTGFASVIPWSDGLMPNMLRDYVRDAADRTQCPPDFVAVALITSISAVVGRKLTFHPKQEDTWEVAANQWGCLIGKPSTMKSPALKQAIRPLKELEDREKEIYRKSMATHKATSEILELERKTAKDRAKKLMAEGKKEAAIAALTEFSEDIPAPVLRRFIVNDATVEKLGELLNENPNGLMLERDELGGWLSLMQSEDGASARAFYLECFDGTNSYTYDRIGRGTIAIESCCLSLIGCIQPSRIAPLVRGAVSGEMDDGLVQRLQLAVWPDDKRDWKFVDRKPDEEAQERVRKVINDLHQLPETPRRTLRFDEEAQQYFNTWYIDHMQSIRSSEVHPSLESHFLKMPQTIASLALLFELIDGGRETVRSDATLRAIDWASYLKSHASRLYGSVINAPLIGARTILDRKEKLPEPFTPREVRGKKWGGLDTTEAVNEALEILTMFNLVVSYVVADEKGGRPSKKYVWRRNLS
ncbi:Protein of unknown function [Stutzerimonas kunmingensis]|uniref:YfjI family protein n=1 Tax=Stutzerimonas kunmingensis TaxID=1211807 RepID=UPI0008F36DC1|nr:YfjI family protein [Stutzerimonas kunmingensis]MCQ2044994.1 YfjI family protein [Stutzerimonas kunmingensis]SFK08987.1 Protein of unknown function [Stutzerimonas kunmingensis]